MVVDLNKEIAPQNAAFFSYSAADGKYAALFEASGPLSNVSYTQKFGASDLLAANSTSDWKAYQVNDAGPALKSGLWTLNRFIPGSANTVIAMSYASFGIAQFQSSSIAGTSYDVRPFAYGLKSNATAFPSAGTRTYAGPITAIGISPRTNLVFADGDVYDVTGTFSITATYSARAIAGTVTLSMKSRRTSVVTSLGAFPLASGTLSTADGTASATFANGSLQGFFAGPFASEMAGAFSLKVPNPVVSGATITIYGAGAGR